MTQDPYSVLYMCSLVLMIR